MAFKVGQKVCCIDDTLKNPFFPPCSLRKGEIYTIRALGPDNKGSHCCLLEEIRLGISPYSLAGDLGEWCFKLSRFRPLVSTNIDVFKAILANPHKQLETVE